MGRVVTCDALPGLAAAARRAGRRVVFTNGLFDLLHVGHLRSLCAARALGDLLVVGLNDDDSARRLKGPTRPLIPAVERAELIAALAPVDYAVIFAGDTAHEPLALLRPAIYVKGGDYAVPGGVGTPLPEAGAVVAFGGEVRLIPLVPGRSTSGLIAQIVARHGPRPD